MGGNIDKKQINNEFLGRIRDFCNIILSKTDTLDLLYDFEQEDNFFKDESTFDLLTNQINIDYFYKNIDYAHYIVDMCCLLHIKKQNDASEIHSPYSFYEFDAMQEYYYNVKYLFKEIHNVALPSYFNYIIEWIILRGEEVDNYNIYINNQVEKVNRMYVDSFLSEFKQKAADIQNDVNTVLNETKGKIKDVETSAQEQIDTKIKNTEDTQKDRLQKSEKNMLQTCIEILGVFSAVVLTFNMGISFASKALEVFMQSSIYHSVLVIILFGFIIGNVIFALFAFLRHINKKDEQAQQNGMSGKGEKLRKTILGKIIIMFNAVLIVLLIIDFCCWDKGTIEARNEEISSKYSVQQQINETEEESISK